MRTEEEIRDKMKEIKSKALLCNAKTLYEVCEVNKAMGQFDILQWVLGEDEE